MASSGKWAQIAACLVIAFVSFCPIPNTNGVSVRLSGKGLMPVGKSVGFSVSVKDKIIPKSSKKSKSSGKSMARKLVNEADELKEGVFPVAFKVKEKQRKQEIPDIQKLFDTPRSFPKEIKKIKKASRNDTYGDEEEDVEKQERDKYRPYYDCDLQTIDNANAAGSANIKPDPFDCACCYYCNWGIHYVQCCSWPLLWNQDISSCDWHWRVKCYTAGSWDIRRR